MGLRGRGESRDPRHSERLEAALDAVCEALFALQLIAELATDEGPLREHIGSATGSLQRAIVELRSARGRGPSALGYGFVAGQGTSCSREGQKEPDQSNP